MKFNIPENPQQFVVKDFIMHTIHYGPHFSNIPLGTLVFDLLNKFNYLDKQMFIFDYETFVSSSDNKNDIRIHSRFGQRNVGGITVGVGELPEDFVNKFVFLSEIPCYLTRTDHTTMRFLHEIYHRILNICIGYNRYGLKIINENKLPLLTRNLSVLKNNWNAHNSGLTKLPTQMAYGLQEDLSSNPFLKYGGIRAIEDLVELMTMYTFGFNTKSHP